MRFGCFALRSIHGPNWLIKLNFFSMAIIAVLIGYFLGRSQLCLATTYFALRSFKIFLYSIVRALLRCPCGGSMWFSIESHSVGLDVMSSMIALIVLLTCIHSANPHWCTEISSWGNVPRFQFFCRCCWILLELGALFDCYVFCSFIMSQPSVFELNFELSLQIHCSDWGMSHLLGWRLAEANR